MSKITQEKINQIIWESCDIFRGIIDPSQYKDYILTILFLKYVSDIYNEKYDEYSHKYNVDANNINKVLKKECVIVSKESSFDHLFKSIHIPNIGVRINQALKTLEKDNRSKMNNHNGIGIFKSIDFNSNNLGIDKDTRLKKLLCNFSEINLDSTNFSCYNVIESSYIYIVSNFTSTSGKRSEMSFTPSCVASLLAKLTKSSSGAKICDITCGLGSLLIKAGQEVDDGKFTLYGQEINGSIWTIAMMNMLVHGFNKMDIRWGDTIRDPKFKDGDDGLMKFDTVISDLPFSSDKWGGDDILWNGDKYNRFKRGVPPKSKGDWAFISHMLEVANDGNGKIGVVVPHGVLFRGASEGIIRKGTIKNNLLEAVIGLPSNLFFGTNIPAVIVIFNKNKSSDKILFIDASKEFEDCKIQNKLRDKDIERIVSTYRRFTAGELSVGVVEDEYYYVATTEKIKEKDYNLNISSYVNTPEKEKEVDIKAVQTKIHTLEAKLIAVQSEIKNCLKELEL